jgi:hypothetical protein
MNDHLHPIFRDILNSFVPKAAMNPQISWTRKNYRDGIQGTIQNTGYLEIESGEDGNTLSPTTVVTFWCDEPKPDLERRVDVLTVTVYGFTVYDADKPTESRLSAAEIKSVEGYCRAVANYQLAGR